MASLEAGFVTTVRTQPTPDPASETAEVFPAWTPDDPPVRPDDAVMTMLLAARLAMTIKFDHVRTTDMRMMQPRAMAYVCILMPATSS